jgi:uncharacterized membrane protein SirB2
MPGDDSTMTYAVLKAVHLTAVCASLALFLLRAAWMLWSPARLARTWVRVVPHVIDTLLLASALLLAWTIGQYPFVHAWVTAKVLALIVYIVLGSLALKHGRTRGRRVAALIAALLVFGYIVSVALTRDPAGWAGPYLG